jgi:hypothetical protein
MKDNFPHTTKETLAKRVGMRCSNPLCQRLTSGPRSDPAKFVNIGVACHITAASENGPRYDSTLPRGQRKSIENGLWLCQFCAKLIDNDEIRFTACELRDWKRLAEERAQLEIDMYIAPKTTAMPDEKCDSYTLFQHSDKTIDEDFSILPETPAEYLEQIKEGRRHNLIDRWDVTGFETASDVAAKVRDDNLTWNVRCAFFDLIGALRIRSLQRFVLAHIRDNYKEIRHSDKVSTYPFENGFFALAAIGQPEILPELLMVSKCILRPSQLHFITDGNSFNHLAFSILYAICRIYWCSGTGGDFQDHLKRWVQNFPADMKNRIKLYANNLAENNRINLKYGPPTKDKIDDRDFLAWSISFFDNIISETHPLTSGST